MTKPISEWHDDELQYLFCGRCDGELSDITAEILRLRKENVTLRENVSSIQYDRNDMYQEFHGMRAKYATWYPSVVHRCCEEVNELTIKLADRDQRLMDMAGQLDNYIQGGERLREENEGLYLAALADNKRACEAENRLAQASALPHCRDTGHTESVHAALGCCDPYAEPCDAYLAGREWTDDCSAHSMGCNERNHKNCEILSTGERVHHPDL